MSTNLTVRVKKVVFWLILVGLLVVIVNLSRGVWELMQAGERVGQAEREVVELGQKKSLLEDDLEWKRSDAYVIQEIRNELHRAKPDDVVVMVDESLYEGLQDLDEEGVVEEILPNWQKWWKLFN